MGEYLSRFTFYDVMGYLLPGLIALCAVLLAASAISPAWTTGAVSEVPHWFVLLVAAYFAGHAVQGLTHRLFPRDVLRAQIARTAAPALLSVVRRAMEHHSLPATEAVSQFASLDALKLDFEDREVLVARQGFFRGSSLSFGFLGVVLLVSGIFGREVSVFAFAPGRGLCTTGGVLSLGLGALFLCRYRDFIRHELEYAAAEAARSVRSTSDSTPS